MRKLSRIHLLKWRYLVVAIGLAWLLIGCTSTVYPPPDPVDPVDVYLLQDDRHLGLVLPRAEGGFVEYGFGDWDWYAEQKDSWYHAFDTVLWPTQGTLARRIVLAVDAAGLRQRFSWMELQEVSVGRAEMRSLRESLARQYAEHLDGVLSPAATGMSYVPHDDGYWFLYTCGDALAGWLRQLGCTVSWVPIRIGLTVAGRP